MKNERRKREIIYELAEIFAPEDFRCMLCGRDIFDGTGLCPSCLEHITFNNQKTCLRCGVRITGAENYCGNCNFEKVWFDRAYSVFVYEKEIKSIIYSLKYGRKSFVAYQLAKYLAYFAESMQLCYDAVCYVPMTKNAEKIRGYNQSRLLAENFCDILEKSCPINALCKVRETEQQEKLGRKDRAENLKNAYKSDSTVKGKRVLLIDDVKTSGATLNECAKTLKKAGALEVVALSVASREEIPQVEKGDLNERKLRQRKREGDKKA